MATLTGPSVIIPVHNAYAELKDCLTSVANSLDDKTQVIIIDDASTDDRIIPLIENFIHAGGPRWRLVHQHKNRGFVDSVNLGMRLSHTDVILLNSDTVVTPGWLERIADCLESDQQIATATPWSNNAEIASIPNFCEANPVPQKLNEISAVITNLKTADTSQKYPDIPTAVGFCMGISRQAIDKTGYFDEKHFGAGYGEENDFCMRARQHGFRNVLCTDAYVAHVGGRSFAPLGLKPDENTMARLLNKHPDYLELVREFIERDPLKPIREQICKAVIAAGLTFH